MIRFGVKATGWLEEELPQDWLESGSATLEMETATLADVCAASGLPANERYMLVVNDQLVSEATRSSHPLQDGDHLTFIAPLSAG